MKAEKTDRKEQVQELTKKLEDGITGCRISCMEAEVWASCEKR